MARLLKVLIGIAVLSTLWDGLLTLINLRTIGFGFEANPIVNGVWSLIGVKLIVLTTIGLGYYWFRRVPFDTRFVIITGLLSVTAGQFYGGYSHIPILTENYQAQSITVGDGNYTVLNQNGSSVTYSIVADEPKTKQYFSILFFIMTFPTIFSITNYYLTKWTSKDIKIQKVKT